MCGFARQLTLDWNAQRKKTRNDRLTKNEGDSARTKDVSGRQREKARKNHQISINNTTDGCSQ
jgi:hypothetical protein